MRVIWALFLCVMAVFAAPFALAEPITDKPLHMTLLSVQEGNNTFIGSVADLYIEIRPGNGRVFLETQTFSKIDTQISTRFAKEVACNYFDLDCSKYDFIYTIRSPATIIGGPSAGGAIAALTSAAILGLDVNESVAVTGTINSGGLLGPIGGLKAKIDAAERAGAKKVLIPFGTRTVKELDKLDLVEYGAKKGINVVEVSDLNEVVEQLTGRKVLKDSVNVSANPEYVRIMREIADEICERGDKLKQELDRFGLNNSEIKELNNRTRKAELSFAEERYYSAASYCFGTNVRLRNRLYVEQNLSAAKIKAKAALLDIKIDKFENETRSHEFKTITDLQTFSIVVERLADARRSLERIDEEEDDAFLLAFAEERFYSAQVWSKFFEMEGKGYVLNREVLQRSCIEKLQEAKERYQYLVLFLPSGVEEIDEGILKAEEYAANEEYELCLMQASQAKAEASAILGTAGIDASDLGKLVDNKLLALQKQIARTVEKRDFPLLGFSYYEYANSLKEDDVNAALVYAEYGLELSNLDIYFEESQKGFRVRLPEQKEVLLIAVGFMFGIGVGMLVVLRRGKFKGVKRRR